MSLFRVHALVAWAFALAILVQVFLAGAALIQFGGTGNFETHRNFGYGIGLVTLVLLVTGLIARRPRREIGILAGFVALYVVQSSLPYIEVTGIAALHPVNAVLMFALAAWYSRRAWQASAAAA